MTRPPLLPAPLAVAALAALFVTAPGTVHAEAPDYYRFLDRAVVGADAFTRAHPSWDGRGVVIAVLDTGVDPGVAGLTALPQGGVKVIEARDFTGEGDVALAVVADRVEEGVHVLRTADGVVRGHDRLTTPPAAGEALRLGFFKEAALINSEVTDLNRDGRSDGVFAVLAYRRDGDREPVCVIDSDGDGDLADEVARASFLKDPRPFAFTHPDPRKNQTPVALAVTVLLEEDKVSLHFDDGGHGTHVAGIAAGFGIAGRAGFDGIAPGARVLSLKIGHGGLAGGATMPGSMTTAIAFASRWAREHDEPVVMNLSYGVGTEREGHTAIDQALDEALVDNRLLVASVSAGNEGPGLSTVGTPAGARLAWTAGALLPPATAEALWGAKVAGDRVFSFSSRGGELDKPDGLTPGVAWSTVPPFKDSAVAAGTSMAAPQATGVHALLVSAALAEKVPWTGGKLVRALRTSARALPGYTRLDQGAGVVRVGDAWEALKRQAGHATGQHVAGWRVDTALPTRPGEQVPGSYWRAGAYLPEADERVAVEITPVFYGDVADAARQAAFDTFELDSDVGWLDVDRRRFALRGAGAETLQLRLDAARLTGKPGLYVGRVRARVAGVEAFAVPVTVVVPHRFVGVRERSFEGRLAVGDVARTFVEVPPGATAMVVTIDTPKGRYGDTWLVPYDPEGRAVAEWEHHTSSREGRRSELVVAGEALVPGVWELDTYASFRNTDVSSWQLRVRFVALELPEEVRYSVAETGRPGAEITVTSRFDARFRGPVTARVDAYVRERDEEVTGTKAELPVTVMDGADRVTFALALEREVYSRFTDVAVDLLDQAGKSLAQGGFSTRFCTLEANVPPGAYTLSVVGATTRLEDKAPWKLRVRETQRRAAAMVLAVTSPGGEGDVVLYPSVATTLGLAAPGPFPELPEGFHPQLTLSFVAKNGDAWLTVPLPLVRAGE